MSEFEFQEEEFTTQFNGQTLLRILEQVKPYRLWMLGFLVAISLTAVLDGYFTYLSRRIIDEGIQPGNREALYRIVALYGALAVVQAASVFGFIYMTGILGERVRYDLRKKLFNHLQDLSLGYFNRTPVGWIMSRVTSDTERIAELVTWGMLDVTWGVVSIVVSVYFMLRINWQLGLMVFIIVPVLILVATEFKKRILTEYRVVRKMNSRITGAYEESVMGVRVTKALGREAQQLAEFEELTGEMYRAGYRAAWLSALFLPAVQLISAFGIAAVVWYGGIQFSVGEMTIGGIYAFFSYITSMLWPVQEMARVYASMQQAIASAERVFSLTDAVPEIQDQPGAIDPGTMSGEIVFDNVEFYYEIDKPVLRDFNLQINPGETIALVGPTGGGKSTIVNLLCRFFEPRGGEVRIGGRDYRDYTLDAIQSRIGVVLQTPHLFSGTIRENIRYGRLDATDEEIEAAAQLAGAHTFIETLPQGYDEEVGEGGGLLSVGQKQLVSLARAVLAEPEIFIMDEATSSVDTLTEALIQQGMEHLMAGRTSFVIAHRLSTIKRADRILLVEDGTIKEQGTHGELIRARGHYYRLYTQQFRSQLEAAYAQEYSGNGNGRAVAG
jgi:ATP-binding cassette, subfamily B, bacterial